MEQRKQILKITMFFMWIVGFFFLTIILDNVLDDSTYLLSSDIIPIAVMLIIWLSLMNYKYRKLKKKEALRISGKIITVKVEKIFSKYVGKQWTKYYLTAVSDLYPHQNFTEEFSKKEYDFLMKHLESGSKLEMFVDYENPKLFLIDFELIERDYTGKLEIPENEQFESWIKHSVLSKINVNSWKILWIVLIGFWFFSLLPLLLMLPWVDHDMGNIDSMKIMQIFWGIAVVTILLGIFLFRKWKKDNSPQDMFPDMFSTKPPKWFDWFPS